MKIVAGMDIGGTKCACSIARVENDGVVILNRTQFPTPGGSERTFPVLLNQLDQELAVRPEATLVAIGISCGGPLDSRTGRILCPPNLPGWVDVDALTPFAERYGVPVGLQNDANACALAEWHWGAGRGTRNMVFLTFGTGMGAGLILNGALYSGASDMGGEVGHLRLAEDGPVGFGKAGSFEGFCSGGGIMRLGRSMAEEAIQTGRPPAYCLSRDKLADISAKSIFEAAYAGDETANAVVRLSSEKLGLGLALIVDMINPELIVIGSIYLRNQAMIDRYMRPVLQRESIPHALQAVRIVPAGLAERVGDYAACSVAFDALARRTSVD